MFRAVTRVTAAVTAVAAILAGTVAVGSTASGASGPAKLLLLPQGTAFSYLGHSCGGIQERAYATGFDAVTGFPTGDVYLTTTCGGSGRGGRSTTYSAWVMVTWDLTTAVVSSGALSTAPNPNPNFSAFDAHGNQVYNASLAAHLVLASGFVSTPRVTGVSVTIGPAAGGTTVTISGTGFTGATAVDFGGTAAAGFTANGDTVITALSPVAGAGTVDITVTTAGGPSAPSTADRFTFVAAPSVSAVSPSSGPIPGGTSVTITGAHFTGATAVDFGDNTAGFTVNDDSSITAIAPANDAPDTVDVRVVTIGGTSATGTADQFTYSTTGCGACGTIGFSSPNNASAVVGAPFSFSVTTFGGPVSKMTKLGKLPRGVTFRYNHDGTATLSGTPTATKRPTPGTYPLTISATFGSGKSKQVVAQAFTLTVN